VHWQPTRPTKHDIAAIRGVEAREIPAVRVGDHGAIPALERAGQQLADRSRLPGSGRAQELEVLSLIELRDLDAGEGHGATARLPWLASALDHGAALVGLREHASSCEQHPAGDADKEKQNDTHNGARPDGGRAGADDAHHDSYQQCTDE
jgi:hypothetical protein